MESFNLEHELQKIPDQMASKIGDVADLLEVKPYVLRYWEQEFKSLNPKKAANNQRIYSRRDVETVILIKKFLYVDQFSIPGARKALKEFRERAHKESGVAQPNVNIAYNLNSEIIEADALDRVHDSAQVNFLNAKGASLNHESSERRAASHVDLDASAELLTEKYIKIEKSINDLISKIKSVRGKLEHRFHQIGL
jgi:DNA-binding transcriptional MerR regulator